MAEEHKDPIEKRSLSKYLFLLGSVFFAVAFYAMIDEGIVRRSWKGFQREFNKIELKKAEGEYEALQAELKKQDLAREKQLANKSVDALPDDPEKLSVKQLKLKLERAKIARENKEYAALKKELTEKEIILQDALQDKGFTKADQDELYYLWKHDQHQKLDYKPKEKKYWELEKLIEEKSKQVAEAEQGVAAVKKKLAAYDDVVTKWEKAIEKYYAPLDVVQRKIDAIRGRGTEIKQVVVDDLGIVDVVQWGKVDRCMSCHTGVDKKGLEDLEAPFATHPHRDKLLKAHPVEQFGCTTCHWGQGRATQIKGEPFEDNDFVHGFEHHWQQPLLRGDFVQSTCTKCHAKELNLEFAPVAIKGKRLFMEKGCIGCHSVQGFEDYPKAGPSLEKVADKLNPEWIVPWILNPREYDPHTYMPQAPVNEAQAKQIASYLWQSSEKYDRPYGSYPGNGNAETGKQLFTSVGCYGCHSMEDKGATHAPTLDRIMEKTNADWVYNWIQDPKSFHAGARMPSLRLSKQEAADVTAYLLTKGKSAAANESLRAELNDPKNKEAGYLLITQYGCYGCHNIQGTNKLSKLSVDLSGIGKKTTDKLDFGDTDIPNTWQDWVFNKIKSPAIYTHTRGSSMMPKFPLVDDEIHALVVYLKGLRGYTPPTKYVPSEFSERQRKIDKGRRLVRRLNCIGCHAIEGEGGDIAKIFEDPSAAPPNLAGQGAKVQPDWLFTFLKDPSSVRIRPWIDVRMPTFEFSDEDAQTLVEYFAALDNKESIFVTLPKKYDPESIEAGRLLASGQYFSCFSCHIQGSKTPSGPRSMWGPDLTMIPKRIRPDFIPPWVQNPQQFTPGVRMPAFLPEKGMGPPNVLGGDIDKQAEAIRDYMLNLHKTSAPQGNTQ